MLSSYSASRSLDIKTIYGFNKFCHRILCNCRVEKVRVCVRSMCEYIAEWESLSIFVFRELRGSDGCQ